MKAEIIVDESFDDSKVFTKDLKPGDLKEFFDEEGAYLDRLSDTMKAHANAGDSFTVTYTVTVTA